MLDPKTKRRIDTCRDILVGKVPDPKSQVEQITIALIYKFMDDMDLESEEEGGKRKFFTGEFERYAWSRLVAPGTSGQDMLNTYSEALVKMPENAGLPTLFRDIFRNAYLPYRDPETLRSFLREINGFVYDHSERLGDAFEYLLSVLGSQGDAGQFRTPRHIIDFMVEIIDPQKDEIILDPACGTAGFLISSYKHILKANTSDTGGGNGNSDGESAAERAIESPLRFKGDLLTPEDRQRLASNIKGYDISPDMVRLSLVNLYLHGFANPQVEEYDTLTSEDKWNEVADVILANPPFMSPKGGVPVHRRFAVQSKRSEVLFVDYIAEHLTPRGRAAVIVPEGIIFQSQSAYCDLRRMLVENYLVAVVSLPAGVFNPYSSVKTSILILDRSIAKACDRIAFFKIENDGFNLGAQRRPVKGGQLTQAQAELGAWLAAARTGEDAGPQLALGHAVAKAHIGEGGDYNLSGERYRENEVRAAAFPAIRLGEICDLVGGATPSKQNDTYWQNGTIKWLSCRNIGDDGKVNGFELITEQALRESSTRVAPIESTILVTRVSVGKAAWADGPYAINQDLTALVSKDEAILLPRFLFAISGHLASEVKRDAEGIGVRGVTRKYVADMKIPLPPLEVQREVVTEIDGYRKVVDGARAVIKNYRPRITLDVEWPLVELAEAIDALESGVSVNSENRPANPGEWGILKTSAVTLGIFIPTEHKAILPEERERAKCSPRGDSVIISRMNTEALVGASAYIDRDYPTLFLPDRLWQTVISRNDISARFVHLIISSEAYRAKISSVCGGTSGSMKNIAQSQFLGIRIPLPPLETQQAVVAEIEAEQALVGANHELIARFERKIETAIARVWAGAAGAG